MRFRVSVARSGVRGLRRVQRFFRPRVQGHVMLL